ncbi:hypothetical protein NDU88_004503 [Pleurodeles waltl]|uniref:Uncharacterized protein n=1 Tax=Pleurodeles waltl TaxID=8319 RepID=A0AAV7UJA1_PLEWA|nr:hypothetical protein NDU88_004503 [Pleurodeles waltl]
MVPQSWSSDQSACNNGSGTLTEWGHPAYSSHTSRSAALPTLYLPSEQEPHIMADCSKQHTSQASCEAAPDPRRRSERLECSCASSPHRRWVTGEALNPVPNPHSRLTLRRSRPQATHRNAVIGTVGRP